MRASGAKGKTLLETELYDGEFFIQKIQYTGLNAANPATAQSFGGEYSKEAQELLQKEGPKYQYGKGCLSDGVLGAWIARMCYLNDPADAAKIKSHLKAVHKYNLKSNLSEHANPQRPSYALGEEGGGNAGALPVGISEALYNTALGIGTSALALIMYNIFTTKIDSITYGIDESGFTLTQSFASLYK